MKFIKVYQTLASVLSVCLIAATLTAQTVTAPAAAAQSTRAQQTRKGAKLPSAKKIFDDFTKATGGRRVMGKFTSRVSTGTVELAPMGARGTITITQKAPNKLLTTMALTGLGEFQSGFDGKIGWSKDSINGLRELTAGELSATRRGAQFNQADMSKMYSRTTVTGRDKVGDREVYVVEAVPTEGGAPVKMYFDVQNGLMLRVDSVTESPQGKISVQSYLEDYRAVDKIKMPFTLRQVIGPTTIIMRFTEIKHEAAVNDTLFVKPAA
ncbi:MAG: hypothetical protein H0V27_03170 [Pyrinomonadaceae bacterium]|nr:hypothetical protein [Pyrinomonadaceae bacterium]